MSFKNLMVIEKAYQVMVDDATTAFPNECCGFFYGSDETDRLIIEAQPVINSKEGDQRRRFEISPFDYMKAEQYAVLHDLTLLGVYHSHPNHPAIPSEHDLAKAMPYFSYIIISIMDGKLAAFRSWQLTEERQFAEEKVAILSESEHKIKEI